MAEIDNKVENVSGSVASGSNGNGTGSASGTGNFDILTITSPTGQKYQICIDDEGIPSFKKSSEYALLRTRPLFDWQPLTKTILFKKTS